MSITNGSFVCIHFDMLAEDEEISDRSKNNSDNDSSKVKMRFLPKKVNNNDE